MLNLQQKNTSSTYSTHLKKNSIFYQFFLVPADLNNADEEFSFPIHENRHNSNKKYNNDKKHHNRIHTTDTTPTTTEGESKRQVYVLLFCSYLC